MVGAKVAGEGRGGGWAAAGDAAAEVVHGQRRDGGVGGRRRLALGLAEEPRRRGWAAARARGGEAEGARREVPLLPRWPLGRRDERATGETKSSKKRGVAAPLTPGVVGGRGGGARDRFVTARGRGGLRPRRARVFGRSSRFSVPCARRDGWDARRGDVTRDFPVF